MRILGMSGGIDYPNEDFFKSRLIQGDPHDSAAVLIEDGKVVAAIEEERINRIKHTGKFPVNAIQQCLDIQGIQISDIDRFVFASTDVTVKFETVAHRSDYANFPHHDPREWLAKRLEYYFGVEVDSKKVIYADHHYCHAASSYFMSGFDRSLVMTIDGASLEGLSGMIIDAEGNAFRLLDRISNDNSLGSFYTQVIEFLGYTRHDEYKVMGLAPYGDPAKFRRLFKKAITLLPEGKFILNRSWYFVLMDSITPRMKGDTFTQEHKDVAAALQETLETVVMHVLTHYRNVTGHTKLCLAGGVAHNCTMNGKILSSGLFEEVFVQPSSHDAGNALGAALYVSQKLAPEKGTEKLSHLYLGADIQRNEGLNQLLNRWDSFVSFRQIDHVAETVAELIAGGAVIGWVQGRSEFGPRALGNRSILADPRPAENKKIINEMVKKREGYRPFAPSVLEEYVGEYYEVPETKAPLSFMNFVLMTREDKQPLLGAVTHVDGSARVQTVSRETNEKYWMLIDEFRKLTGVPILLNTSFNNNVEPIVDTEEDAIVSFLTTNIHHLVIGDYVIEKKVVNRAAYQQMVPNRLSNAELIHSIGYTAIGEEVTVYEIRLQNGHKYKKVVSKEVFHVLKDADGQKTLEELLQQGNYSEAAIVDILDTLIELWSLRLVSLRPCERVMIGTVKE